MGLDLAVDQELKTKRKDVDYKAVSDSTRLLHNASMLKKSFKSPVKIVSSRAEEVKESIIKKFDDASKNVIDKLEGTSRDISRIIPQEIINVLKDFRLSVSMKREINKVDKDFEEKQRPKEVLKQINKTKFIYEKNKCDLSKKELKKNKIGFISKWFGLIRHTGRGNPNKKDLVYRGLKQVTLNDIRDMMENGVKPVIDTQNIETKSLKEKMARVSQHRNGKGVGDGIVATTVSKSAAIVYSKTSSFGTKWNSRTFTIANYLPVMFASYFRMISEKGKSVINKGGIDFKDIDTKEIRNLAKQQGLNVNDIKFNVVVTINAPRNQQYGWKQPGILSPSNQEQSFIGTLKEIVNVEVTGYGYTDKSGKYYEVKSY